MKPCRVCHKVKPLDAFHRDKRFGDGRINLCKTCALDRYQHNDHYKSLKREWGLNNQDSRKDSAYRRAYKRSLTEIRAMLAAQENRCLVCTTDISQDFHVDHDHNCCSSEKVKKDGGCGLCTRGLLCESCNLGLGQFSDDPIRLQRAIKYLNLYPKVLNLWA